jgi:hypothetical protein
MKVINKFENKLTHLKRFLKDAVYNNHSLVLFSPFKTHKSITNNNIKIIFVNKHDPIFSFVIQGVSAKTFEPNNSVIFQRIFVKFKIQLF